MSDRKITAPGPGWRMPGKAKSTSVRDAMPNLLNAMGDSIERSNKMDFGTPGVHTQNGFHQPHNQPQASPLWVLLETSLPPGTYNAPSNAIAIILDGDNSIGENSLRQGTEKIVVWNYSSSFSASSGDWVLAIPFGNIFAVIPAGSSGTELVDFVVTNWFPSIELNTGCEGVYATVTAVSCGSSVQVGDEILVWDPRLCWFNLPFDILVGLHGTAAWMKNPGVGDIACPQTEEAGDCIWIVKTICCSEEVYA